MESNRLTYWRSLSLFLSARRIAYAVEVPSPRSHLSRHMTSRKFPGAFALQRRHLRRLVRLAMNAAALALPIAFATALSGCVSESPDQQPLVVFAASDLRDALADIARDYRQSGGDSAVLVFGSTGDLATQIANGAPADLFFAASAEAIDQMVANGHALESSREPYAMGRLAILARCIRADTAAERAKMERAPLRTGVCPRLALADLVNDSLRTIAIADPAHAPYGRAARQVLERTNLWDALRPKLVLGANISQAELFVTSGNADAGIIALSLLQGSPERTYTVIDASLHDPLIQTVVIVSRSTRRAAASGFLTYARSAEGRMVLQRYGFELPASDTTSTSSY